MGLGVIFAVAIIIFLVVMIVPKIQDSNSKNTVVKAIATPVRAAVIANQPTSRPAATPRSWPGPSPMPYEYLIQLLEAGENVTFGKAYGFNDYIHVAADFRPWPDDSTDIWLVGYSVTTPFYETEGLGTKVLDEDFTDSLSEKKMPLDLDEFDTIAGATVSSQAVINALNDAYENYLRSN